MNTTAKPRSTTQLRDVRDISAERCKEVFETIGDATTEAADVMKNCCSTALKGMEDYNSKVIEFSQAKTKSYAEFVQKLSGVKSPTEFFEVSTDHGRYQLETVAEQAKQLAELVQKVTLSTVEPLTTRFARAYKHAA